MIGGSYFAGVYPAGMLGITSASPGTQPFFASDSGVGSESASTTFGEITIYEPDWAWASDDDVIAEGMGSGPEVGVASEVVVTTGLGAGTGPPPVNPVDTDSAIAFESVTTTGLDVGLPPVIIPEFVSNENWTIDGFALQTIAYNVVTWGADRQKPPPLRGSNTVIPYRPGSRFRPKVVDSRSMSLLMWVIGVLPNGQIGNRGTFETNWRQLRRKFWRSNREFVIQKTFYDDLSNGFITAKGKGQYTDGLSPEMNGTRRASFAVDIFMADPYFYDISTRQFTLSPNGVVLVPPMGDAPSTAMTINMNGPSTNPTLTDSFSGIQVKYNGTIAAGQSVILDVSNFSAKRSGNVDVISAISHSGDPFWMKIGGTDIISNNSVTRLVYDAGSGSSGSISIQVTPVWL